jgi:acyl carrier protein
MPDPRAIVRQLVVDWLDDQYHFGETESLLGGDEDRSFLEHGVLDSLGFVRLVLYLEARCGVRIDRRDLSPANFGSLQRIVSYLCDRSEGQARP